MYKLKNRILKLDLVYWRNIQNLQPDNFKSIYNYKYIEQSIIKNGFSNPFYVWENKGILYSIDGITRREVLSNLENVPEQLPAIFIDAKSRKEAIKILLEVFNQKENPIQNSILTEWLQVEDIKIEEVNIDSLSIIDFEKGIEANNMTDNDIDIEEEFDPIGDMNGRQRVVFIFDGSEEAERYLKTLKVHFKKMNMAWQVNMCTQSI
jgi:hypothetical protein